MGNHVEKKPCDSSVNIVEMILISIVLFFFFDLLIIDKTSENVENTVIKILTGSE